MPIIYGFLERITYHNEENDFVVAKLQEKGKNNGCDQFTKNRWMMKERTNLKF